MAENPMFNNSNMFTNVNDATHKDIEAKNASEVLATQGNVINSIKTFWNKLRAKLAYAISRHDYGKQVGGNYVPIFVDTDGVVQECQPTTIQADIAQNGIITIPTDDIPNDSIYTGTTVCISVLNNRVSDVTSNLQIQHNNSMSPVNYPSGVTVLAGGISKGDLLLATFCKNSTSSSNNFWILLNKINTVVSTAVEGGGHPGLMTAKDKAKLDTIDEGANNYSLPKASSTALGGIMLGYITNENDRKYKLQTDDNGNGYVNVPWTVYSLPIANKDKLGGVKSSSNTNSDNNNKIYHVGVNTNGIMTVNVPWTDTKYSLPPASSFEKGGVKLGADKLPSLDTPSSTSDAGKYYPIQTDKNDKLVVNVPWTDTNTHNTAYLYAGNNNNSTRNEATNNGYMYLKIVDGDSKTSSLKISGTGGTKVTSNASGDITINSPSYTVLNSSSSSSNNYLVHGAGYGQNNNNYYLAGNGTWVKGILVPVPPTNGNFTLKCNNGVLSWD